MAYIIGDDCVVCNNKCTAACPVGAIYFDGDINVIDQEKCIGCGKCKEICGLDAVIDTDAPSPQPRPHAPARIDCDILVIGGGHSGLVAAVRAADLLGPGKKIVVLEKTRKAGGSGWYSAGTRPYTTPELREAGVRDKTVDYTVAAINTTFSVLNPQLVYNAYQSQNDFFEWYRGWGEVDKYYAYGRMPGAPENMPPMLVQRPYEGSNLLIEQLLEQCAKRGIEILLNTCADELIMEDGRVAGVRASDPGGSLTVLCGACLMAAGGCVSNKEILDRCIPGMSSLDNRRTPHARPASTGDGIALAEKAGIPIDYDNICAGFIGEMHTGGDEPLFISQNWRAEVLKINLDGRRWVSEHPIREGCTFALLRQPKCEAWLILDRRIVEMEPVPKRPALRDSAYGRMMRTAVPADDGTPPSEASHLQLGPEPPALFNPNAAKTAKEAIEQTAKLKGEHAVIADTLEELAEKMGVPADSFLETVRRYNELCDKGHDDDFYKYPEYLIPIREGPFYAIHNKLCHDGVFGGFYIDENMNVLGADGPIPGLYASGDNTSSRFVNRGGQRIEIINDSPWALGSGFIAGTEMAEFIKGKEG